MVGLWRIWTHRNSVLHGEVRLDAQNVLLNIKRTIVEYAQFYRHKLKSSNVETRALESMEIVCLPILNKRGKWVTWEPPHCGIKLNFDASFKARVMGRGGFRDPTAVLF